MKRIKITIGLLLVLITCFFAEPIAAKTENQTAIAGRQSVSAQQPSQDNNITVGGTVRDAKGNPIAGVTVKWKSTSSQGVATDIAGKFTIDVPVGETLVFSYVGMISQEIAITQSTKTLSIRMTEDVMQIDEVTVSTGIFVREKATYTGNISSFTREELKSVSSRDFVSALAVLDPSFAIVENIDAGSNPNAIADIQIRGGGAAALYSVQDQFSANPNMPLFVLNGVEVPFSRIKDLDPNRIQSTHILKDAGSTAIYGSKGANGVIVIETVKPTTGEYNIYYNGRFSVDTPDLTVYNMMNSTEKLEFDRLSGKFWRSANAQTNNAPWNTEMKKLYNHFQQEIARGVDTYWMSEPVTTAFSQWHSISVNGGSEELALNVGADFGSNNGVMKNNSRDTWAGVAQIMYRAGRFIITNDTDVNGFTAKESNYGSFKNWVNASPYFTKYNEEGGLDQWLLESFNVNIDGIDYPIFERDIPNPMWNASLNSKDETKSISVQNKFMLQFNVNDHLQIIGDATARSEQNQHTIFKDPDHTDFAKIDKFKKGRYTFTVLNSSYFEGRLRANYGNTFNGVHNVGASFSSYITQSDNNMTTMVAEGFPSHTKGSPQLAHSYKDESKPDYALAKRRTVGVLLAMNYNYDQRYLLDVTIKTDGATTFGSNKLYKPFWSVGLGWNINREKFTDSWTGVDIFRITGTIGTNGNQNIGQIYSKTVYQSFVDSNVFGQGLFIAGFGAPDLPWSTKRKIDVKMEIQALQGRISAWVSLYHEKTDPLIINMPMVPSNGMGTFPTDMGYLTTRGVDFNASFSPIYNKAERIYLTFTVNGIHLKSEYGGFSNQLSYLNLLMKESNNFRQYADGYSPDDLWAVKSYGIDPATGQEVFVKKNGKLTFRYNRDDEVKVGSSRADLTGIIRTRFRYKNFELSAAMRYSFGGSIYNKALYDKVENIKESDLDYNQDARALYSRWKSTGDIAQFRSIAILNDDSPRTSRFIQKNNFLNGTSLQASYDFNQNPWLRSNLGIRNMSVSLSADEFFRWETSKYERGIDSPFARLFTLGVSINF